MTLLNKSEKDRLQTCEKLIERGLNNFIEVGTALLEIRDNRLYRVDYSTFEEYCRDRWSMSRVHAHRMIHAAQVTENLLPIGNKPESESVVRPLTKLPPAEQQKAWNEAVATAPNGKPTAKHVQDVVMRHTGVSDMGVDALVNPPREHVPDDDDSNALWNLKRYWKRATKKEKAAFLKWVEKHGK